ncbi:MAG: LysM peptidoglycan-binding domain-containing protein [Bacteroidetes bacterium]|nr:LysM peptidoglycan-binding domain-containing protein [Bacteroidota bacterium]
MKSLNGFGLQATGFKLLVACGLQLATINSYASPPDSLRMETINGKQYIIHQVDPKETLFSISRRYGVPVTDLAQENPSAGSGLSVGQILKVPYIPRVKPRTENGNIVHKVAPKETLFSLSRQYEVTLDDLKKWNNLTDNALNVGQEIIIKKKSTSSEVAQTSVFKDKLPDAKTLRGVHTVTAKETLFSISKMYGATVMQLKEWNKLTGDELKPGQVIYVLPPVSTNETYRSSESSQVVSKPVQEIKISESVIGSDEIHEKGMAALLEGTDGNRKYLAQHRSAKPGSIIKVRNEANKQEVFVRVVGQLDSTDETLVKISKSAFDRLGSNDQRFAVEVIRFK